MAHLDVVPVDEARRGSTRRSAPRSHDGGRSGAAAPSTTRAALVAICEAVETLLEEGLHARAGRLAVVRLRRGGHRAGGAGWRSRSWRAAAYGPGSCSTRAARSPPRRSPAWPRRSASSASPRRASPPWSCASTAAAGTRRPPRRMGPTARLARAITRLDRVPDARAASPSPTVELLRRLAPHAAAAAAAAAGQRRPAAPACSPAPCVAAGPETAAMTRTTFAVTTLSGSPALNVIASTAPRASTSGSWSATPSRACSSTCAARSTTTRCRSTWSRRTSRARCRRTTTTAFALLEATIGEVFPDAVPAPYVMMAATDSRFFTAICDRVYRFAPFRMTKAQRESIHSYDEHLGRRRPRRRRAVVPAPDREDPRMSTTTPTTSDPRRAWPGGDRRVPGLRRGRQRRAAGLLHADLQRHRRPPRRSPTPTSTGSRRRS